MTEFWQQCVNHLSQGLTPAVIKQWIMPLVPIGFNDDETEFHIAAPSPLKQNWAQMYYAPTIQALIKEKFNHDASVVVLIHKNTQTPSVGASAISSVPTEANMTTPATAPVSEVASVTATENTEYNEEGIRIVIEEDAQDTVLGQQPIIAPPIHQAKDSPSDDEQNAVAINQGVLDVPESKRELYQATHLNPNLTFANLVVGHSNELAEATAKNVVRNLGRQGYNPLFLYGSTGLGKTHLMHAIGNELFKEGKVRYARYIHANDYYTEISAKMREGKWVDYRLQDAQEYARLDLLLIDDIQFFRNKERTQQEFFHLYEALVSRGKQIVICSDTYPRELKDIEERLISRFNSGMTIQIEPPELEMRVAILMKKAENHHYIELTDEAAFFIAKHIRSNVRELEGGLQKVIAFAQFRRMKEITVDICKEALKDLLRVANGLITVENIQKTVADFYKIKVADIYSKSRRANIVRVRHVAMYLAKELTRKSLPELGQAFGGRDHSTVHHAVERITELRATDRELNHELHVLEQTLKG